MSARRWLDWTPTCVSADAERTDKTDKRGGEGAFVGFGGAIRTPKNTQADRMTADDAAADLTAMHREIAAGWPVGAFAWADSDQELRGRLAEAEAVVDRIAAAPGGPLRSEWTAAIETLATTLRLIRDRFLAHQERDIA